ncbi:uncharacterized protein I206_103124 [Kwoniella pini CBS 10737]|uniref:Uncharacterized protein n=1 Tax=Kwoniella pini CBS 10737 TaxID=1296096 RepID=A0A1B9IAJ6_9TREE|nr:uncharacterized protein I206_01872 [Kwoniella pini CBS 10737]OCF52579.1 hypothetical protein I206_01872 [Kwoniella pini CBS 10737]
MRLTWSAIAPGSSRPDTNIGGSITPSSQFNATASGPAISLCQDPNVVSNSGLVRVFYPYPFPAKKGNPSAYQAQSPSGGYWQHEGDGANQPTLHDYISSAERHAKVDWDNTESCKYTASEELPSSGVFKQNISNYVNSHLIKARGDLMGHYRYEAARHWKQKLHGSADWDEDWQEHLDIYAEQCQKACDSHDTVAPFKQKAASDWATLKMPPLNIEIATGMKVILDHAESNDSMGITKPWLVDAITKTTIKLNDRCEELKSLVETSSDPGTIAQYPSQVSEDYENAKIEYELVGRLAKIVGVEDV